MRGGAGMGMGAGWGELGLKILNSSRPVPWCGAKISPHPRGVGKTHVRRSGEGWIKRSGAKLSSLVGRDTTLFIYYIILM